MQSKTKYTIGFIHDKYLKLLSEEAKEEDRTLTWVLNRIMKKHCAERAQKKKEEALKKLLEGRGSN